MKSVSTLNQILDPLIALNRKLVFSLSCLALQYTSMSLKTCHRDFLLLLRRYYFRPSSKRVKFFMVTPIGWPFGIEILDSVGTSTLLAAIHSITSDVEQTDPWNECRQTGIYSLTALREEKSVIFTRYKRSEIYENIDTVE